MLRPICRDRHELSGSLPSKFGHSLDRLAWVRCTRSTTHPRPLTHRDRRSCISSCLMVVARAPLGSQAVTAFDHFPILDFVLVECLVLQSPCTARIVVARIHSLALPAYYRNPCPSISITRHFQHLSLSSTEPQASEDHRQAKNPRFHPHIRGPSRA